MNEVLSAYFQELREAFVEFNNLSSIYPNNKTALFNIFNSEHIRNLGYYSPYFRNSNNLYRQEWI